MTSFRPKTSRMGTTRDPGKLSSKKSIALDPRSRKAHMKAVSKAGAAVTRGAANSDITASQRAERSSNNKVRRLAQTLVANRRFEIAVALLIMSNAAVIGLQADWSIGNIGQKVPVTYVVLEYIFNIAFSIELIIHILDEGNVYFSPKNVNMKWNLFDSILVVISWLEDVVKLLTTSTPDVSAIRTIRVARLARILRVLRVMRFFRELRHMVQGILVSLQPLFWCLVLLFLVMFTFGVCILQVTVQHLEENPTGHPDDLMAQFGGLYRTIYTLFITITGGMDWGDAADLLNIISPIMPVLYCFYISFAVLCTLNIVTGVFVENAKNITGADTENMVLDELSAQEKRMRGMMIVFSHAAGSLQDVLRAEDFVELCCQDTVMQAYMRTVGLDVGPDNASNLFSFIDEDGDGIVNADDFLNGCARFGGNARQLDLYQLHQDVMQNTHLLRQHGTAIEKLETASAGIHSHSLR